MNVFFVEAPHQLLNGLEVRHALNLVDNEVVVLASETHRAESFKPLLDGGGWNKVRYLEERPPAPAGLRRFLRHHPSARVRNYYQTWEGRWLRQQLDAVAAAIGPVQRLVMGCYYRERGRHLANVLPHEQLVLLDDGTTTLELAEIRRRHAAGMVAQPYPRRVEAVIDSLIGWNLRQQDRVTFFTTYELALPAADTLVPNSYEYLRGCAAAVGRNDEVLFLGGSLTWEGVTEDVYIEQLQRVDRYYSGAELVYVPHKAETAERIDRIRDELGWVVRRYDVPIEYHLAMRGPLPGVLSSFFSSALENCRVIFGKEIMIEAIYFDPELLPLQPDFVKAVYDYFESQSTDRFRVVRP